MRKVLAVAVAGAMLFALPALEAGAAKKKKKKAPKPLTVMTDPSGDAGSTNGTADQPIPVATEGGLDLTKGVIGQKGKDITFTVEHAAMPSTGSGPEAARLIWGVVVGGEIFQLNVKSVDVGKPDVLASALLQDPQGEERIGQVYQGIARLEQCGTESAGINFSKCETLSYHKATFDPAKKTASWAIPAKALKAKKGTPISSGGQLADTGCHICWIAHYAERSLSPVTIIDSAVQSKIYKVG
jgi:hypothetical protein